MGTAAGTDISYEDLYSRWEHGNWSATDIDLSGDAKGWRQLTDLQRRSMRWQFAMFLSGEDSVADNLSPYIDAAPKEEQKYFLATQQVDEARHAVFFTRFFREVMGVPGSISDALSVCRPELNWGYRETFARLDRMAEELRRDPSPPRFAQAICMYHIVVEATLAQPGQHVIEDYVERMGGMPGFLQGIRNVARDEQRHIGFGVKVLSDLFATSAECKEAVVELLGEVMPHTLAVFVPPGFDRRYAEVLGFTLEEVYAAGFRSFETKLRAAGLPPEELPPGILPLDYTVDARERARTAVRMLEAGITPDPTLPAKSTPEAQRLMFEALERSVDPSAADGRPLVIQWRFEDAQPWHLRIDGGPPRALPGEDPHPTVVLETRWPDWVDIAFRRKSPGTALLQRKLRPKGGLRGLWRMQRLFPR